MVAYPPCGGSTYNLLRDMGAAVRAGTMTEQERNDAIVRGLTWVDAAATELLNRANADNLTATEEYAYDLWLIHERLLEGAAAVLGLHY